jgi:hypothetical protein
MENIPELEEVELSFQNCKIKIMSIEDLVIKATNNFTKILSVSEIDEKYDRLKWGRNGIGDRWANKKFNYTVIYKTGKTKVYSENENDVIPSELLIEFMNNAILHSGIIGIYVHSKRLNNINRLIRHDILKKNKQNNCVICGTTSEIICDHKNDLYNDVRVLNTATQLFEDFQALCNHCNLQKRQICKYECENQLIYSAKKIPQFSFYNFDFPWEKKVFDKNDINCKVGTYWYDPIEFNCKINKYSLYIIPIINEIKFKIKIIN